VEGMLAGCLTGLPLGAASGFLHLCAFVLAGSSGTSWSETIGLLCLSGIFLTLIAILFGAAIGALPGLFIGCVVGAVSALLRGGLAGRMGGLVLGAILSPLLLAGSPWECPITRLVEVAAGAIGGYHVAARVRNETRRLA
jgi:urea transporter